MRQRALLPWRSPPRLSRWRSVLPEEAWIGLAPAGRRRTVRCAAGRGCRRRRAAGRWRCRGRRRGWRPGRGARAVVMRRRRALSAASCCVEVGDAPGEVAQGELGDRGQVVAARAGTPAQVARQLPAAQTAQLVAQLIRGGDDQGMHLVERLGAGLVRAAMHDLQRPQRLDRRRRGSSGWPVASPLSTARAAAIASTTSVLPWRRRACRFGRSTSTHLDPGLEQEPGQPDPVGAGALDPDRQSSVAERRAATRSSCR